MPVRGGPHAELALRFADALADRHGATVVVMHLVPAGVTEAVRAQAERALASFVRQFVTAKAEPLLREAANVRNAILREAEHADLVVMGASAPPGEPGARCSGPSRRRSPSAPSQRSSSSRPATPSAARPSSSSPARRRRWPRPTAQPRSHVRSRRAWSAGSPRPTSTTPSSRISRRLLALKQKQNVTVWLVLPTLNESETIGPIVRRAISEMQERYPLLDEILVIDSASDDDTREIAEAEGARVVQHPDVLARYGSFRGKGEALWKSLYETSGDIIVWADTDVRNWHHRMVYGTLGPLLVEPRLQYVKGYYQRPIVEGGVLKEGGGGRVTELVARPLINLFFPELSGLIQPLSGEYAGRRALLEQIPFFTGYAVEIGHLIDALDKAGLGGLGQVDLERRVHRNQELEGLSRMSFVILQAVMKRLEERRRARLFAELGSTMKLPRSGRGRLSLEVQELADHERPPMVRIPEYLERRRADLGGSSPATERSDAPAAAHDPRDRAHPDRARLLQGNPHSVEVAGHWRRAGGAPARTTRSRLAPWPTEARARSSRSRRPVAGPGGRRRPGPAGPPVHATLARAGRWAGGLRGDGARRPGCRWSRPTERDRPAPRARVPATSCRAVLDAGIREIALGIGGSATTDGGAGFSGPWAARWARPRDVDLAELDPRLAETRLRIACDVTNPLLGTTVRPRSTGPRRVRPRSSSRPWTRAWHATRMPWSPRPVAPSARRPGAGAAGGVGFGLLCLADRFASLALVPGIDLVMAEAGFDQALARADLVITGEGRIDAQTAFGKTAMGVARRAQAAGGGASLWAAG